MTGPRFRLGAEELIEMGRSKAPAQSNRRPFLSGRARRASMGAEELIEMGQGPSGPDVIDALANAGEYLAAEVANALDVLEALTGVKVEELAQGADVSFEAFSTLVESIPTAADLLALVLVAGAPFVKYGLTVPGLSIRGLGNIMAGAAKVLANRSLKDNQVSIDWAKKKVAASAPADAEGLRADVKSVLDSSDVSGEDLAPRVDMETGKTTPEIAPEGAQA